MARVFQRRRAERFGGGYYEDYYIAFRDELGQKISKKIGRSKRRAEFRLAECVAEVEERKRNPLNVSGDGSQPFTELLDEYIEKVLPRLSESERGPRRTRLRYWREHFGPRARLRDITRSAVDGYRAAQLDAGKAVATVNRELAALKAVMTCAVDWKRIPASPVAGVRLARENNARDRVLTADEVASLVAACRDSGNRVLAVFVVLLANTGARRGEALALRWADIDTSRGLVSFRKTKSKITRQVPVEPWVLRELETLPREGEWIFMRRGGRLQDVKHAFRSACDRAELGPDVLLHTLRHTFATRLAEAGTSPSVIQRLTGHASLKTLERYTHPSDQRLRDAVAGLNLGRPGLRAVDSKARKPSRSE